MPKKEQLLPVIKPEDAAGGPIIFEKIAIVGLGLIGGSIALSAREQWPNCLVIGVDKKEVLEKAMVRHMIDVASDDPVVMAEADLVILAAPVRKNIELVCNLKSHIKGEAVVTDVGSTKRKIIESSSVLPSRLTFIGGHPLAGAPRGGIEHSRSDLFVRRPWLFTPTKNKVDEALNKLQQFVVAFGAEPHVMSPVAHDKLVAFISHLPQLTASALMHVVGNEAGETGLGLTGRGLADTTRLASSPSAIWEDICATNADAIGEALDELVAVLQKIRNELDSDETIAKIFKSASEWREVLSSKS